MPDTYSTTLVVTPYNGPECSTSGISFNSSSNQYAQVTSYSWGGVTSFEAFVMYSQSNLNSRVFDFGSGEAIDEVVLYSEGTTTSAEFEGT